MEGEDGPAGTSALAFALETLTLTEPPSASATSIPDPLAPVAQFSSPSDLCYDLESLDDLASRGQWRAVLEKINRARSFSVLSSGPPHQQFAYLAVSVLALFKLRRYRDADLELQSIDYEFDSPNLRYESYPNFYPNRSGSMLPFAIRFFHAEIPFRLHNDRSETLDRLYSLLDLIRTRISLKEDKSQLWTKRESFVIGSLCRHHFSNREFDVCLLLIQSLLSKNPSDPAILSRLAYVLMQIGDLDGAMAIFDKVDEICRDRSEIQIKNLVGRNNALRLIAVKDYRGAVKEYEVCIERDPADIVAINNKALCLMYSRDLGDSIKVLEGALERVPTAAVNETAIVNLCSMYELAYTKHLEVKKSLNTWIARVAPDDFDPSCTRI